MRLAHLGHDRDVVGVGLGEVGVVAQVRRQSVVFCWQRQDLITVETLHPGLVNAGSLLELFFMLCFSRLGLAEPS